MQVLNRFDGFLDHLGNPDRQDRDHTEKLNLETERFEDEAMRARECDRL